MRKNLLSALGVALLVPSLWVPGARLAAQSPRPIVREATRTDSTRPLRDMPQLPPKPAVVGEIFEKPFKLLPNRQGTSGPTGDAALQTEGSGINAPASIANFEGVGNVNGVLPPDPVGDIGPNHYVQMVNLSFAIWDRSGNKLYGPVNNNTLWQGFGGPCETSNWGDPIVLYDEAADRWMLSQFALPNFPNGPFYQCIAVSQTGDPTGAYHRYEFTISQDKLNDYPKFGVWPDGYYMAINQFKCSFVRCSWAGQGAVVFERDKMLNGQLARMVYFDNPHPDLGGMLPSDLDGATAPPAGAPNPFIQVDDDAWGSWPDQLRIWNFSVNWTNPSSSTFAAVGTVTTAAFDANMCSYSRNCIPQPGGASVDAISDRLMHRLQYRNFGTHQTLVTNHTVDVNGTDRAGVRWYELRNTGSGWSIHQQGTFSPDSTDRWMASAAMNGQGDIAVGYSISSGSIYPSIYFTGRFAEDTLGQMTQGEGVIVNGSGYQQHSSGRWGDYSSLNVDPTDDCTFWYTQEYYAVVGSAPWQTRIGAFKLRDCGPVDNPPTVSIVSPAEGATVAGTVTIQIQASDTEDAAGTLTVEWNVDGGAWQTAAYNSISGYYEASWNSTGVGDGAHTINARAKDSANNTATDSHSVTVDNIDDPPTATLVNPAEGATVAGTVTIQISASDDKSGLTVEWQVDSSGVWQPTTFNSSTGYYEASWNTTTAAEGAHTVHARATDSAAQTATDSNSVTVDNIDETPPSVNIVSPSEGSTVSGTVTIQISATDNKDAAGSLNVQWNIDGGTWAAAAYNSSTGYYEASWNTTSATNAGHTVNARATDAAGNPATDSNNVTVDNTAPAASHVGDLDGASINNGNTWTAQVTITVHDGSHGPVSNATVSGSWSGGASGSASCITDGSGQCTVSVEGIHKRNSSVTFSVTGVTHATLAYNSPANHDPDGDSNGTSINVSKP